MEFSAPCWEQCFQVNQILVMGLGQKFLTQVGSGQFFVARVGSAIWKISPKNPKFSDFFTSDQKIVTVWVKKYPGPRRVSLLFTVGQRYARVGSGQGQSLSYINLKSMKFYLWILLLQSVATPGNRGVLQEIFKSGNAIRRFKDIEKIDTFVFLLDSKLNLNCESSSICEEFDNGFK